MNRFLRYSLERQRKIRLVLTLNGALAQRSALVVSYNDASVTLQIGGKKQPVTVPLSDILSCDYARGDHGED